RAFHLSLRTGRFWRGRYHTADKQRTAKILPTSGTYGTSGLNLPRLASKNGPHERDGVALRGGQNARGPGVGGPEFGASGVAGSGRGPIRVAIPLRCIAPRARAELRLFIALWRHAHRSAVDGAVRHGSAEPGRRGTAAAGHGRTSQRGNPGFAFACGPVRRP